MKIVGRTPTSLVWLAWDEKQDRDVALKFLPEMVKEDASAIATLKREIRKLTEEVKHAQLIQAYDLEQDGSLVAIVSEFVEGASVTDLREQKPNKVFAPQDLMDWMQQLCTVMVYAHGEAGVSHGDLTTANLLVNKKGVLRITGLGMAKHIADFLSRTTELPAASINLCYHSPQRMAGGPPTPLDDIYSIGTILYELLTSKPPFYTGDIQLQVQHKVAPPMVHRRKELRVIGEPISRVWEEAVAACLSKDPAQRPQTIQDLVSRLELEAAPSVEVQEAAPPPPPPSSNKPLLIAAGAIICLLGILGLVIGRGAKKTPGGPPPPPVVKVVEKQETPEEKAKRAAEKKKLADAEASAKALQTQLAKLKEDEAKRAADAAKREAEAKKVAEAEAKKRAEMEAELKKQQAELAKRKEEEERMKKAITSAKTDAERKAAEDALKKAKEAEDKAKQLEAQLADLKKKEDLRKAEEAKANSEAAKKKKEADAKMAAMIAEQAAADLKRRQLELEAKQRELAMAAKRDAEEKAKIEAARIEAERKAKEAEMARKRFSPGKPWENSVEIRFLPVGKVMMAAYEVRVADFDAFVRASRYNAGGGWRSPGFRQDESHPVVNVSWADAKAFCKWLTEKESKEGLFPADYAYRLPTDVEWSLAAALENEGAGAPAEKDGRIRGVFPWGNTWPPPAAVGNYTDRVSFDTFENTAPVGSFKSNKNGLYDLGGNVWEWCEDWSDSSQKNRVLRGGSWFGFIPGTMETSSRRYLGPEERKNDCGFRIVLDKK
ncbi:MAG: SUMF1/EgtB/PvdO family nonheme iron enzyme [Verrucomicrobiota bacterium]